MKLSAQITKLLRELSPLLVMRLQLGPSAVLPAELAVRLVPGEEARTRRWLREHQLVRNLLGVQVVVWGDIVDAVRGCPVAGEVEETAAQGATAAAPRRSSRGRRWGQEMPAPSQPTRRTAAGAATVGSGGGGDTRPGLDQ